MALFHSRLSQARFRRRKTLQQGGTREGVGGMAAGEELAEVAGASSDVQTSGTASQHSLLPRSSYPRIPGGSLPPWRGGGRCPRRRRRPLTLQRSAGAAGPAPRHRTARGYRSACRRGPSPSSHPRPGRSWAGCFQQGQCPPQAGGGRLRLGHALGSLRHQRDRRGLPCRTGGRRVCRGEESVGRRRRPGRPRGTPGCWQ